MAGAAAGGVKGGGGICGSGGDALPYKGNK